jgi:hypothetical protein
MKWYRRRRFCGSSAEDASFHMCRSSTARGPVSGRRGAKTDRLTRREPAPADAHEPVEQAARTQHEPDMSVLPVRRVAPQRRHPLGVVRGEKVVLADRSVVRACLCSASRVRSNRAGHSPDDLRGQRCPARAMATLARTQQCCSGCAYTRGGRAGRRRGRVGGRRADR